MKTLLICFLSVFVLFSCSNESSQVMNFFTQSDSKAPQLKNVSAMNDRVMKLVFDEEVFPFGKGLDGYNVKFDGCEVFITLPQSLEAGKAVTINARVRDKAGNSVGISTPVWGYNPCPASLIINEFTVDSTEKQPQRTELYSRSGGYVSGLCLYAGIPDVFSQRVILPSVHVNPKTYIVVWWTDIQWFREHFKLKEEYYFKTEDVLHVCACTSSKIPASNGVLCLTTSPSPGAGITDCVFYSKKSATSCNGFGSEEVLSMAEYIDGCGMWDFPELNSSYAADISSSSATKSVCRKEFEDTNSCSDWYVTERNGFSFGAENNLQEFKKEE